MTDRLYALTEDAMNRVAEMHREFSRRPRSKPRYRARWGAAGGGSCPSRNEIHQLSIFGSPTTGSFDATYTVLGLSESMTFNSTFTSTEVATEMATHTSIATSDIEVTGGPFPNATMQIEFVSSLAAKAVPLPTLNWDLLAGGTGVAVIASRPQNGYPGDASTT